MVNFAREIKYKVMEFAAGSINELDALLKASRRPCIVSHSRPDGDAAGSSMAFYSYLKHIGKDAHVVWPNPVPDYLEFLNPEREAVDFESSRRDAIDRLDSCDLLICLDFNRFSRIEGLEDTVAGLNVPKLLIDHHPDPEREAFDLVFSETGVSSTCELLYLILKLLPGVNGQLSKLPLDCRTALLAGMTTDTNNFANSVFPSTFQMASDLIASGVDRAFVLERLYNDGREARVRAIAEILLKHLEITEEGAAIMTVPQNIQDKYALREGELEGLVNIPLGIREVKLSMLLREAGELFRVSLRSKKGTSANRIAREFFHGGGHEQASGGKLFTGSDIASPDEAVSYARKAAKALAKQ